MLKNIAGTPQQPNPNRPGLAIPIRVNFDAPDPGQPAPAVPEIVTSTSSAVSVDAVVVHIPFKESFNANTREVVKG